MASRFFLYSQGESGSYISCLRCRILNFIFKFYTQITHEIIHKNGVDLSAEIASSKKAFISDAISFDFAAKVC